MSRTVEEMLQFPLKLHFFFCHGLKLSVHTEKTFFGQERLEVVSGRRWQHLHLKRTSPVYQNNPLGMTTAMAPRGKVGVLS